MANRAKIHARDNTIVLSVSHVYILALIAEVSRLRGDFSRSADLDGFHRFIDTTSSDPFAKEIRYLVDHGYVIAEDVPRSQSGTNHCKLYHLTEKGSRGLDSAVAAYGIIAYHINKIIKKEI